MKRDARTRTERSRLWLAARALSLLAAVCAWPAPAHAARAATTSGQLAASIALRSAKLDDRALGRCRGAGEQDAAAASAGLHLAVILWDEPGRSPDPGSSPKPGASLSGAAGAGDRQASALTMDGPR